MPHYSFRGFKTVEDAKEFLFKYGRLYQSLIEEEIDSLNKLLVKPDKY
jgi:hypothetical protein